MEVGMLGVLKVNRKMLSLISCSIFLKMNPWACGIPRGSNSLDISVSVKHSDKSSSVLRMMGVLCGEVDTLMSFICLNASKFNDCLFSKTFNYQAIRSQFCSILHLTSTFFYCLFYDEW